MIRSPAFVADLATAIADRTPVDWEAARRKLGGGGARFLDQLQLLARVADSGDREVAAATTWRPRRRLGLAASALLSVTALLVVTAAVAGLARPEAGGPPFSAFWSALAGASFFLVGLYLVFGGKDDERAVFLGLCYLTLSAAFAGRFLARLDWAATGLLVHLHPDAFAPYFLWQFARRFPRTRWFGAFDVTARRMARLAGAIGLVLFTTNALVPLTVGSPLQAGLRVLQRGAHGIGYWGVITLLTLPVLIVLPARARRARPDERQRSGVFLGGLVVGIAPVLLEMAAEVLSPTWEEWALRPENLRILAPVQLAFLSMAPVTTAYSVLSDRVLEVGLAVRRTVRFLLARTTLGLMLLLPFALLVRGLRDLRHLPLGEVFASPEIARLGTMLGTGVALWVLAPRLSRWLDRAFFRDVPHAPSLLSSAVDAVGSARSAEEALQGLATCLRDRLKLSGSCGLLPDETGSLRPIAAGTPPWPERPALSELLEVGEPVRVEPDQPGSVFAWLPPAEQEWVLEARASLLLPLSATAGSCRGLLVLGERLSQQAFAEDDVRMLGSVARAAGLALGRHAATSAPSAGVPPEAPARLCPRCALVSDAGSLRCRCGAATEATVVPWRLAGRIRMLRLLGRGGMGVVFEGHDEELDRRVAVKTLPKASPAAAQALRREARAMARVSHPALATIYGVETWRYTPILLVELLNGGTLGDRLRDGQVVDWPDLLSMGAQLCRGLSALHRAGLLHRDVKPSNIGFTAAGEPKLLDLGVAELFESVADGGALDRQLAGTLAYLPPEAFRGEAPSPGFDVWSLSVTLIEAATGVHPFRERLDRAGSPEQALAALAAPALPAETPPRVRCFCEAALHAGAGRRPGSTPELAALLGPT